MALSIWLAFFSLYAVTAAPSLVAFYDDSLEFQLVGPIFGIAHPTGYPLYVILGGLWSRVLFPVGNWSWRMNLFSALAAATTVMLLFLLTQRFIQQITQAKTPSAPTLWPGLAAAITFGLSPVWWSQATIAEVYALHNLFIAAILLVALNLSISQSLALSITQSPRHPVTHLCLLFGLALTHHRTTVLLVPGVAILLWGQRAIWRPSCRWLGWGVALLAPLLLYLWLPLRAGMGVQDLHGSYVNSWSGFWEHVLARGYTGFFAQNSLAASYTFGGWWRLWQTQVGLVGLIVGLWGMGWAAGQGRPMRPWLGVWITLLTNLIFAVNYQVGDQEVFLLPAWLAFALFIGVGVYGLTHLLKGRPRLAQTVAVGSSLLLLLGVGGRGPLVNRSQEWTVHDEAVALAKVDFPPNSRVIALEGQATALTYLQVAEGLAQNAQPVVADTPEERQAAVATAMAQGYPTYLTQEVESIGEHYSFSGEGPLVRVWPRGQAQVGAPSHQTAHAFADGALQLTGYDLAWLAEAGGPTLRVTFYWRPTAPLTQVYKLSLRLIQDGTVIVQEDRYPLRLAAFTPSWVPGETLRDVHYLRALPALNPQITKLRVILYVAENGAEAGTVDLPTLP
ncbi:MAG: DUF2723 domain-containing protein [Caldilineaceae bacterium]